MYGWRTPKSMALRTEFGVRRGRPVWSPAVAAGSFAFARATVGFQQVRLPALPAYAAVVASLVIGILFMRLRESPAATGAVTPDWDLPLRIVLATGLVL